MEYSIISLVGFPALADALLPVIGYAMTGGVGLGGALFAARQGWKLFKSYSRG